MSPARNLWMRVRFAVLASSVIVLFLSPPAAATQPEIYGDRNIILDDPAGDFNFYFEVSKYTYPEVAKLEVLEVERSSIVRVMRSIDSDRYEAARRQLLAFDPETPAAKKFKTNYMAAVYFGEGDYESALRAILDRYRGRPRRDIRYRWEIAYVTYFMRREKGVRFAEDVIARLQNQYGRLDISYVWMAIHPNALMRLLAADLYPHEDLHDKQMAILQAVVEEHPSDPFIDHALYFLHRYDELLNNYPDSIIRDRAQYARAARRYQKDIASVDFGREKQEVVLDLMDEFLAFIVIYPDHVLTDDALYRYGEVSARVHDPDVYVKLLAFAFKMVDDLRIRPDIREKLIEGLSSCIAQFFALQDFKTAEPVYVKLLLREDIRWNRGIAALQLARQAFSESRYRKANEYYNKISPDRRGWYMYGGEEKRIQSLGELADLPSELSKKERLWRTALILKKTVFDAQRAVPYFEEYRRLYAAPDEVPKLLMLEAFCYRDSDQGKQMVAKYLEVVEEFPKHRFADDALAELGVFYLLWGVENPELARRMFRGVIKLYPGRNAVDNSYNWIAYSYLREKKYGKAFIAYLDVLESVPASRFGSYALANVSKLIGKTVSRTYSEVANYVEEMGAEKSVTSYMADSGRKRVAYASPSGRVHVLAKDFPKGAEINDLRVVESEHGLVLVRFAVTDRRMRTAFFWHVGAGEVYRISTNLITGKEMRSPNLRFSHRSLSLFFHYERRSGPEGSAVWREVARQLSGTCRGRVRGR